MTVECSEYSGPDSRRDDCWDGLQRSPTEPRRTAGEGAAKGWRLLRPRV